jgi:hypothetical protein
MDDDTIDILLIERKRGHKARLPCNVKDCMGC